MPAGGLTAEGREIFAVRQKLLWAWELMDTAVLTAALVGGLALLILSLLEKNRIPVKNKLIYTGVLGMVLLMVPLLLGSTDSVYSVADYLITPVLTVCRLLVFLLVSVVLDALRRKRDPHQTGII